MVRSSSKVAIIGSGFVGSSVAFAMAINSLANEIVLIDVNKEKAFGEAMDINHGISYVGQMKIYSGDYRIVESILKDQNTIMTVGSVINDFYGIDDVVLSLPCVVNHSGISKYFSISMTDSEIAGLRNYAQQIKLVLNEVKNI